MPASETPQAAGQPQAEGRAPSGHGPEATSFDLPFVCPESAVVDGISLASLIAAVSSGDGAALALLRTKTTDPPAFDALAAIVQSVRQPDFASATRALAEIEAPRWRVPASIFCALAAAAAGDIRSGLAVANRAVSELTERVFDQAPELDELGWAPIAQQRDILNAGLRCLAEIEKTSPRPAARPAIPDPFCYLISYPRSGNTMVRQFLSLAFAAPTYSVYPGDGRYFSRYFHDTSDPHAVFVKDHEWRDSYGDENVLAIVRDGRDATLSYARFLYGEGQHRHVRAGELADFLQFVTERGIGFWGDHVRQILAAREQGARIRIVRYESFFGDYARLSELARELAGDGPQPHDDEAAWHARMALRTSLPAVGGWSPDLALPADTYLPQDWSVGGGTIDWRRGFDAAARRRFHELGGTEALQLLGYESDSDWWRMD
jgi:hypothetical protein